MRDVGEFAGDLGGYVAVVGGASGICKGDFAGDTEDWDGDAVAPNGRSGIFLGDVGESGRDLCGDEDPGVPDCCGRAEVDASLIITFNSSSAQFSSKSKLDKPDLVVMNSVFGETCPLDGALDEVMIFRTFAGDESPLDGVSDEESSSTLDFDGDNDPLEADERSTEYFPGDLTGDEVPLDGALEKENTSRAAANDFVTGAFAPNDWGLGVFCGSCVTNRASSIRRVFGRSSVSVMVY